MSDDITSVGQMVARARTSAGLTVAQVADTTRIRADAHGLLGMRHRVEAAGGSLTVSSTPGEGTLVSAVLPHRIA